MLYGNLELGQPGNPACPNLYTPASTLVCPRSTRLQLQVFKHNVFVQLGQMPQGIGVGQGAVVWFVEEPWTPVTAVLVRKFDAVRVRNWAPGEEAEVFVSVA